MAWNMMGYGWSGMMGYTGGYMMAFFLIFIVIYIWALVDILQAKKQNDWKILWFLVLTLVPVIGFFLYLIIGRNERSRKR